MLVAVKIYKSFGKHHDDYGGHLITVRGSLCNPTVAGHVDKRRWSLGRLGDVS